jgi:CRP/FNR family transcriptional regulator
MVSVALLRGVPWLHPVSDPALRLIAAHAVDLRFPKGRVLFTAGETPDGLLLILEGRVRVVRGRGGRQQLVHEEVMGGTLGEVPVFSGGAYPATAIAAGRTRCACLPTSVLKDAIQADPELACAILRRMAQRTRALVDRLDRLGSQAVKGRLAAYLLSRQRFTNGAGEVVLEGTQSQMAEELGTVREVLVRALREFRNEGLIESLGRRTWRILNVEALRTLAD